MALTTVGTFHMTAASLSLAAGAVQLLRPRGDTFHRRSGYVYVTAMAVNNVTALAIYRFTGGFNVFHALATYSLISVALALRPMLITPKPLNWYRMHYMWMSWSYVGLSAAAATEFLVRVMYVPGWLGAVAGSLPVGFIGGWLVMRNAPPMKRAVEAHGV